MPERGLATGRRAASERTTERAGKLVPIEDPLAGGPEVLVCRHVVRNLGSESALVRVPRQPCTARVQSTCFCNGSQAPEKAGARLEDVVRTRMFATTTPRSRPTPSRRNRRIHRWRQRVDPGLLMARGVGRLL